MPWQPAISMGLDYAWTLVLNIVHQQHLQFGRDVIFTYGCWGFVEQAAYYPATRLPVLWLNALLILLWTAAMWLAVGRSLARNPWLRALTLLAVLVTSLAVNPWFTLVTSSAGAIILCHRSAHQVARTFEQHWSLRSRLARTRGSIALGWLGLMLFMGVCSHMKFTYNMLAVLAVVTLTASLWLRRGKPAVSLWILPGVYVVSWLGAWMAMGQSLANLPRYVQAVSHIVGTYGDAMAYPGPAWQGMELLAVTLWMLGLAGWVVRQQRRDASKRHARRSVLAMEGIHLLGAAGLLFVLFKSAIIRQGDGHFILVASALTGVAYVWIASGLRSRSWPGSRLATALILLLGIAAPLSMAAIHGNSPLAQAQRVTESSRWRAMTNFLAHGDRQIAAQWQAQHDDAVASLPAGDPSLTTDVYPQRPDIAIWLGASLRPRPTLQSYIAADPWMLQLNADALNSPSAPQRILLVPEPPLDGHYPANFDSLSWPTLLTRYNVVKRVQGIWVLQRIAQPRPWSLQPIPAAAEKLTVPLGQRVEVPAVFPPVSTITKTESTLPPSQTDPSRPRQGEGIWVTFDLEPTWWGALRNLFYKRPLMEMEVTFANNMTRTYRIVPGVARAGFMLSPYVSLDDWGMFARKPDSRPYFAPRQVTAIRLKPRHPWLLPSYREQVKLTFEELVFEPQP
jgi:hypothetical protein